MNAAVRQLLDWGASMFVWTAALFVAARLLDRALAGRVSPSWRMLLYAAIPLRLVLPTWVATPVGIGGTVGLLAGDVAARASSLVTSVASAPAPASAWAPWSWWPVAAYVLGVVLLGVAWVRRLLRPGGGSPVARLAEDAGGFPVVAVAGRGPEAVGILRRRIVLPTALLAVASRAHLGWIVRHERAHLERHDPAFFSVLQIAVIALWPLVPAWLTVARLRALAEMACDARVLRTADRPARSAYMEALLMTPGRLRGLAPVAAFAAGGLDERVAALRPRPTWPALLQAAVVVTAALGAAACSSLSDTVEDRPDDTVLLVVEAQDVTDRGGQESDEPAQVLIGTRVVRADRRAAESLGAALGTEGPAEVWLVESPSDDVLAQRPGVRVVAAPLLVTRAGDEASVFVGESVQAAADGSLVVLETRADGSRLARIRGRSVYVPAGDPDFGVERGLLIRAVAAQPANGNVPVQIHFVIVEGGTVTREVDGDVTLPAGRAVILVARPPARSGE